MEIIKQWLEEAHAIVINAGAGMGRDSGLADYRGEGGQWGALETETGQSIFEVVNPQMFLDNPARAWGVFLKRMVEYERTTPHEGFQILLKWIKKYALDYFVLTSNIDGHFQKAGFAPENVRELHGSLAYFQSGHLEQSSALWRNEVPAETLLAQAEEGIFPLCPDTTLPARPNVYMFRDDTYINTISKEQEAFFQTFLERNADKNIVVFEIGSGPHVQTVRLKTRLLKTHHGAKIVRINPKDFAVKPPHIGIAEGALKALKDIDAIL